MGMQLSLEEKAKIVAYHESGKSQKALAKKYGVNQSKISRVLKNDVERGSSKRKPGSGRKSSLSSEDLRFLKTNIKKDSKLGSNKLKTELNDKKKKNVSARTIRRGLCSIGLPGRVACSKPYLSPANILDRYNHAKVWIYFSQKFWNTVIWSDETKINLFGSDGRRYVRRAKGTRYDMKNLKPTVKHGGGSVMVWGCFSYNGVGEITIIDGTMDSIKYTKIIDTCLQPAADKMNLKEYVFQQDNDAKHRSKHTKEYFEDRKVNVMSWPSQSPDMNPIEHLWTHLKKKICERLPKNINELKVIIKEEWEAIDPEFCKTLVESMPDRAEALYRAKGKHTRY
jgi:transposase